MKKISAINKSSFKHEAIGNLVESVDLLSTACAEITIKRMDNTNQLAETDESGRVIRSFTENEKIEMFELFRTLGKMFGRAMLAVELQKMKLENMDEDKIEKFKIASEYMLSGTKEAKKVIQKLPI